MKNAARFDPGSTFSCFRVYCGGCRVKVGDKFMSDEPTHKVFCVLKETTDVYLRTESQRALLSQFLPTSMTLRDKPPTMQQLSLVSRSLESSTNHQQLSVPMSQSWKLRRTKLPREEWWVPPVISKDPRALAKSGCSTSVSWEQAINNGAIITGYMLEMAQVCVRVSRASEIESED